MPTLASPVDLLSAMLCIMQYRAFGRSGLQVSAIGCGGHREGVEMPHGLACTARFFDSAQERARVVGSAVDRGITYFDSTYGCEIESLGESLRILGQRDRVFCSAMRVDFFANYLRKKATSRRMFAMKLTRG